ncbi:hypothetical protein [Cellulomonas sp. HZM]|uniref:hypothetical protein n=1 Tax=Cellulomonas sp. HZM TaxID=1454010 RepID=UPI0004938BB0|nr:hypothetical protein [Cellulomonas sp. HZM]
MNLDELLGDRLDDLADAAGRAAPGPFDAGLATRVVARVRHRRAARRTGTGVAAVAAAGAIAFGVSHVRTGQPAPVGPATSSTTPTPAPSSPPSSPTSDPDVTSDDDAATSPTAGGGPESDLFACDEKVTVTIHTLPDARGLTLAADLPESGGTEVPPTFTETLGTAGTTTFTGATSQAGSIALVDADGVVAAFVVPGHGPLRAVHLARGETTELSGPNLFTGCDGPVAAGTYTAWPYVVVTPMDDDGSDATSQDPVVVVANPREITLH